MLLSAVTKTYSVLRLVRCPAVTQNERQEIDLDN